MNNLNYFQAVVRDVEFLEVSEGLKAGDVPDPVGLDAQDPQRGQAGQVFDSSQKVGKQ